MLPKLADDADAARAVGGDRCYLSSPAASSQIVPSNKAINLIDQHISFIATFMLQLEDRVLRFDWKSDGEKTPLRPVILLFLLMNILLYLCILSLSLADRRDYVFFSLSEYFCPIYQFISITNIRKESVFAVVLHFQRAIRLLFLEIALCDLL